MKRLVIISVTIALTLIPLFAHASAGMARLTLTQGDVLLFDNESNDWVPAAVNTPIEEGDRIWCPEAAKAEIQLKSGSVIRLGSKTSIDVVRLSDDEQQVYLGSGRLYARTAPDDRELQIDTEDATVSLGRKSRVHVDILGGENPDTEVSVLKGSAYVEGSSGKTRVRSGEDLIFSENGAEIAQLNPPDKWELWNADRDRKSSRKAANHHLPEELVIYEDELAANGEWVQVEDYGYAWRPTIVAEADWVPYQQGRWVWRRGGYVWIASEPWGWAPHHYGRWYHSTRYGWCWVPPRRGRLLVPGIRGLGGYATRPGLGTAGTGRNLLRLRILRQSQHQYNQC
ncbi:fecR protein [Geobacter sp. OR-1]|uniref:FecR family protein n=1 Tax=Geobacter sp. OR-1 TaxID=1266765 RepID=UPI000542B4EA|nr:FecR family protein [Geobacter sp. OR-1]GAM08511.1 fecR protein [Geobacter sp. OR-1]